MTQEPPALPGMTDGLFAALGKVLERTRPRVETTEIAHVTSVGDGVAEVHGFTDLGADEIVRFESGVMGYAFSLNERRIGVVLLGAAGISAGLFVSSLTSNQISSFLIGLFVLLVLTLISQINRVFALPPWAAEVVNFVSFGHHFSNFQRGLIDTRDLLYYGIVSALFLYLNTKTLIFRKW